MKRLVNAGLISAQSAAALKDEHDTFERKSALRLLGYAFY
jgi:hypothetical protein